MKKLLLSLLVVGSALFSKGSAATITNTLMDASAITNLIDSKIAAATNFTSTLNLSNLYQPDGNILFRLQDTNSILSVIFGDVGASNAFSLTLNTNAEGVLAVDNITLGTNDLQRLLDEKTDHDYTTGLSFTIYDVINELENEVPKFGETNALSITFSDFNVGGPVGYNALELTGVTPQYNWDVHTIVYHYINDPTAPSQTGTPKPGQTLTAFHINTNAFTIEITTSGLLWNFQKEPVMVPSNSWIALVCTYIDGQYKADVSGPASITATTGGGTGRATHPQNYALIGNGPNSVNAAAITNGLTVTGSGQAMTMGLDSFQQGLSSLSITTATAGVSVLTNSLILSTNTSVQISGKWLFSGETNTVGGDMLANYRFGTALSVTNNNFKAPSGSAVWAYWTTNAEFYPVLQVGGVPDEPGYFSAWDIQQRPTFLNVATVVDPWAGYVWTESFEGTGTENTIYESSGVVDHDNTDLSAVSGTQTAQIAAPATAASTKWLLPSEYGTASGRFSFYADASPTTTQKIVFALRTPTDAIAMYVAISTSRTIRVYDGNNVSATSANGFSSGEWITIYYEYTKGTGANDAVVKAGWSNDGTKTSNANNIATVPNSNMTADVGGVQIRCSAADPWTINFDAIVVHPTFDWSELPAGLPSGM